MRFSAVQSLCVLYDTPILACNPRHAVLHLHGYQNSRGSPRKWAERVRNAAPTLVPDPDHTGVGSVSMNASDRFNYAAWVNQRRLNLNGVPLAVNRCGGIV